MEFVVLRYSYEDYYPSKSSNMEMCVLGGFLTNDVRTSALFYKEWSLDDQGLGVSGNHTFLEKEDGYVYLTDIYSDEKIPTTCKISVQQFAKLLGDWDTILKCVPRPLKIKIILENSEFAIKVIYKGDSAIDQWRMKVEMYLLGQFHAVRAWIRLWWLETKRYYRRITATKRYVRLEREWKSYAHDDGSDAGMDLLGAFLERNVELSVTPYKEWLLDSSLMRIDDTVPLYKKDGCIVLKESFPEKKDVVEFAMTAEQCMQLLDDWDTKVCIPRPKIVTIWYDNDQFMIETSE